MTRRRRGAARIVPGLGRAIVLCLLSWPALADDAASTLTLSANATLTTDYIFRGISQNDEAPAMQAGFEAIRGIFFLGLWGSNVDFGADVNRAGNSENVANVEIDWYGGIRPEFKGIKFELGAYYYSYPGSLGSAELDYLEIGTGASYTLFKKLTLGVTNWWSPEYSGDAGLLDVLELSASYPFKKVWFFTPTASALFGRQWGDESEGGVDYSYWNAGFSFDFYDKPALSFDIRYWDTNLPGCSTATLFQCDARVVGSLNAVF
jgi:uncharacterized protein (TIGR02001 family)